jgi:hypothetical protein
MGGGGGYDMGGGGGGYDMGGGGGGYDMGGGGGGYGGGGGGGYGGGEGGIYIFDYSIESNSNRSDFILFFIETSNKDNSFNIIDLWLF